MQDGLWPGLLVFAAVALPAVSRMYVAWTRWNRVRAADRKEPPVIGLTIDSFPGPNRLFRQVWYSFASMFVGLPLAYIFGPLLGLIFPSVPWALLIGALVAPFATWTFVTLRRDQAIVSRLQPSADEVAKRLVPDS